jgi:hypothetical protein
MADTRTPAMRIPDIKAATAIALSVSPAYM